MFSVNSVLKALQVMGKRANLTTKCNVFSSACDSKTCELINILVFFRYVFEALHVMAKCVSLSTSYFFCYVLSENALKALQVMEKRVSLVTNSCVSAIVISEKCGETFKIVPFTH